MNISSPSPSIDMKDIIGRHSIAVIDAAMAYIRSSHPSPGVDRPTIVEEQCFVQEGDPVQIGFFLLHSTGLYGVQAILSKDGDCTIGKCAAL